MSTTNIINYYLSLIRALRSGYFETKVFEDLNIHA